MTFVQYDGRSRQRINDTVLWKERQVPTRPRAGRTRIRIPKGEPRVAFVDGDIEHGQFGKVKFGKGPEFDSNVIPGEVLSERVFNPHLKLWDGARCLVYHSALKGEGKRGTGDHAFNVVQHFSCTIIRGLSLSNVAPGAYGEITNASLVAVNGHYEPAGNVPFLNPPNNEPIIPGQLVCCVLAINNGISEWQATCGGGGDTTISGRIIYINGNPYYLDAVYWARCLTNWYNTGSQCDHVYIEFVDDCNGTNTIDELTEYYREDYTAEGQPGQGVKVDLPVGVPYTQDPNVEADDVIAVAYTANGQWVCVSDYLDDMIGTIKMSIHPPFQNCRGWGVMNGQDNGQSGGGTLPGAGTGTDASGKFLRMLGGDDGNGGLLESGGREQIAECDLNHTHQLDSTGPCIYTIDSTEVPEAPAGDVDLMKAGCCLTADAFDVYQRYQHSIAGEDPLGSDPPEICDVWGDEQPGTSVPEPALAGNCADNFGPLNIMNPFINVYFIERVDNSQQ